MTNDEFLGLKDRVYNAVWIDQRIKILERALGVGEFVFELNHNFHHPDPIDISFFDNSPEIKALNEKIYALVKSEYEKLLEQLRAEFAALT